MAKTKRPRGESGHEEVGNDHTSREKRVKYTDEDARLAKVYDDLANEVQTVRIKAAGDLLKELSAQSPGSSERRNTAETRLIKGLCSGRKSARLGFSVALTELFRMKFNTASSPDELGTAFGSTIPKIFNLTDSRGNISGQERRDLLIGCRFALQALLQSDVGLKKNLPDAQWLSLIQAIFSLANEKQWVRRECGAMLYEYLTSTSGSKLGTPRVQTIADIASENKQWKTPEGVGLWLTVQERFPEVKLPKGVWHHNNPLSSKERLLLSKVLLENAVNEDTTANKIGSRQSSPSFVWTVITAKFFEQAQGNQFARFWESCVASPMFSSTSSTERKSLGLQIFSLGILSAPASKLEEVFHPNILRCIIDQRSSHERALYKASNTALDQIKSRAKQEPGVAGHILAGVLRIGVFNLDQVTKSKTIESVIGSSNDESLEQLAENVVVMLRDTQTQDSDKHDTRSRNLADILLTTVRLHKDARSRLPKELWSIDQAAQSWLGSVLGILVRNAYDVSYRSARRVIFQSRLMSCLECLLDSPLEQAVKAPTFAALRALESQHVHCTKDSQRQQTQDAVKNAKLCLKDLLQSLTTGPQHKAFLLLLSLSILQTYNEESDAVSVLEDVVTCYKAKEETGDSTTMLIELLLSFISKPSKLCKKLARQVFLAFAPEVTPDSLQSLIDILEQKENLSGQQELFEQQDGEDDDQTHLGAENEDEEIDVEDMSDVEIVSGDVGDGSNFDDKDDGDDDDGSTTDADEGSAAENEEIAAFDKKLADALGTAGIDDDDSDADGSDMDDEQMMALEPHLTTIFKEQQKQSSQKKDKKDAKQNISNFKNRVLELLLVYVKSQYASVLALDLILPLTALVRTTSNKLTAEKAFNVLRQYFDACSKNKSLPQPNDQAACFSLLSDVHEEMCLGGSKLHANACSRSSLFLSKILVAVDPANYGRIASMYATLQSAWYLDPKSKIQGSVFTEWTSWSIATRKHT